MFRPMRRSEYCLGEQESLALLGQGTHGTLAVLGDEGYPYAVPLNYAVADKRIFFHCALEGHKLDAIERESKVSFCAVLEEEIVPENFDTRFTSVVAFGGARLLQKQDEIEFALRTLIRHLAPDHIEPGEDVIRRYEGKVGVVEIAIEHITAKKGS